MQLRFYKSPFLFLMPLFILGVLIGELVSFSLSGFFVAFVLLTLVIGFFLKEKVVSLIVFGMTITLLGSTLIQFDRHTDSEISLGTNSRVAVVEEVDSGDKVWKKHILRVESERHPEDDTWGPIDQEVVVYCQHRLRKGDVVLFRSELENITNSGNPGEFDAKGYWNAQNISKMGFMGLEDFTIIDYKEPAWWTTVFDDTRNYLSELISNSLPEKEASLARALILGDKSKLSGETRESFGNAGAMHVLAISGLHVGIIMYLLFFLLKRAHRWISRRVAIIVTLSFLWVFAGVTGWSPSVLRATLMFSLLLIGQQWLRSGNPLNTLFFSGFILLLIDPLLLFNIGFQLSYAAMLGIFMFFDRIQELVKVRNYVLKKVWEGTALGIAAQMFTIPIVLYHFHQFPNYFWLTNLGIMCLAGIILASGLVFFATHFIPYVNLFLAMLLGWALFALIYFVSWVDSLPYGVARGFVLSSYEVILFVAVMVLLLTFYRRKTLRYASIGLLVLMVGSWQWDRFSAKEESEVVVFNSNAPVIVCKHGGEIRGFYIGRKDKADRLVNAYSKVMPGDYTLDSLSMGVTTVQLGGHQLRIEKTERGVHLKYKRKSWFVRMGYRLPEKSSDVIIDMPYLEGRKEHYNLTQGAFRIKI